MKRHKRHDQEEWLLDTLAEVQRLIIAQDVIRERRLVENPLYSINDTVNAYLFSALMVNMGWKIPRTMYEVWDDLVNFISENEDDIPDGN